MIIGLLTHHPILPFACALRPPPGPTGRDGIPEWAGIPAERFPGRRGGNMPLEPWAPLISRGITPLNPGQVSWVPLRPVK